MHVQKKVQLAGRHAGTFKLLFVHMFLAYAVVVYTTAGIMHVLDGIMPYGVTSTVPDNLLYSSIGRHRAWSGCRLCGAVNMLAG